MTLSFHRLSRTTLLGGLVLLLSARAASPAPMTWEFTGTTTSISSSLASYFDPAAPVVFTLTFDPTHPALVGDNGPLDGQYRFDGESRDYFNFDARIGDRHYYWSQRTAQLNMFADEPRLVLDTSLFGSAVQGDVLGTTTLWHPVMLDFGISWLGQGPFPSSALPTALPGGDFHAGFQLGFTPDCDPSVSGNCPSVSGVNVELTTVRQVPAPPTVILLGLGLLGAAVHRRLRRDSGQR